MSKTKLRRVTMHVWTDNETEELLRAAVFDDDCWGYCTICGLEICPVEPDAAKSWCEHCNRVVNIDGLRSQGLI
jgi:hypothetical protein